MTSAVIDRVGRVFDGAAAAPEEDAPPQPIPHQGAAAALDHFIEHEIAVRLSKAVSWRQLETCFKWKCVRQYMRDKGIGDDDVVVTTVRDLLQTNKLGGVEYDAREHRLIRLGIPEVDGLAEDDDARAIAAAAAASPSPSTTRPATSAP